MIFTDRKITIRNGKSSINEPVILYRGDYEVSIKFTIMESKFRFKSGVNLVDSEKASHGQLAILAPYGGNVFSEIVKCEDGTVTFTLTKEMIDQLEEVGLYSFQIRLFDYYRESRVSIPPVEFGIEVREPVASEDHDNTVNNAIVGYSIAKVADGLNEDVGDTFDADGQYNKTDWETGDRISEGKLNKIEDALDEINQNALALDRKVDSNYNALDSKKINVSDKIKSSQLDTSSNSAKIQQVNLSEEVKKMMAGNTPINAEVADGGVTTEKYADNSITFAKLKDFRGMAIIGNTNGKPMNFDMVNRKIILPRHSYITMGGRRMFYNGDGPHEISFADLELNKGERSLVFDLNTNTFKVVRFNGGIIIDKFLFIACWWSNDETPIFCTSPYTVNGEKVDNYGVVIKNEPLTAADIQGDIPLNKIQNVARNAFIGGYNDGINFDFTNKQVIIPKYTYIMVDTNTSNTSTTAYLKEDFVIDISGQEVVDGFRYLVYDTSDKTYKVIMSNKGTPMSRNMHTIATWWSSDDEYGLWCYAPKYLVNGKSSNAINITDKSIKLTHLTHAPRNIFLGNAFGRPINFDFTKKEITIPAHCYIMVDNYRTGYNGDGDITVSWASLSINVRYFVYDLDSATYKVLLDGALTHNMLLIATWWSNDSASSLTCYLPYYAVGGVVQKVTQSEVDSAINSALESIEVGDPLQGFDETTNIPLYKSKLFLFEGINMPFFFDSTFMGMKSSMIKALNPVLTYIDDKDSTVFNDAGLSPLINTSHFGGNKVSIRYNAGVHGVHYERTIDAAYRTQDNVTNKNPKILMIGDSLTEWGTPHYTKQILQRVGIQPTMIGTYKDYMNVACEGKGSWTWTNYIGRNTRWGVNNQAIVPATGNTSAGNSCPFWKEATAEDKANHPDWCFKYTGKNSNEQSYAEATDKSGTFYIFDMEYYLSKLDGQVPDAISIALGTNDLNISYLWNKDVYELMELSLEIMLTQIRKVLPNTPIAIIPIPVRGAYNETAWNLNDKYAIWYSRCVDKVNSLGFNNVDILSIYAHMSRDYVWGLNDSSCVELNHGVKKNVDGDTTHFRELGQRQFGAVTASYFGNVIE